MEEKEKGRENGIEEESESHCSISLSAQQRTSRRQTREQKAESERDSQRDSVCVCVSNQPASLLPTWTRPASVPSLPPFSLFLHPHLYFLFICSSSSLIQHWKEEEQERKSSLSLPLSPRVHQLTAPKKLLKSRPFLLQSTAALERKSCCC